ncbi:MAG: Hexapeptide transferase family protein [Parcubacteria group bacterium GW2011_GWD2_38_11]|nr:MAG: Hexapeptide transferase family protein [Parcubacteria group bacterium GW2011_GWD2_38_11]
MLSSFKLIKSDWESYLRFNKKNNLVIFLLVFFHNPGMMFSFVYRWQHYFLTSQSIFLKFFGFITYPFYFIFTYYILDINIDPHATIGGGVYMHNRGIIIAHSAVIGKNVHLIGPLTIGTKNLEDSRSAVIGDDVTIGTGARIIGNVKIGNNVIIGANAVVVKDIPDNCVVGGVPAEIIKQSKN